MLMNLREISLVKQTTKNNCVAACLSMVTGIGIETVEKELQKANGVAPYHAEDYLKFLVRENIYPEYSGRGMRELLSDDTIYLLLCSGSFNPASAHMVVGLMYKGQMQILDPSDDLENEKIYCSVKYNNGDIPVFQYISLTDCEI